MILEYHRPTTIEEALALLARKDPVTWPLGGGTHLNRPTTDLFAVVDLQALTLNTFEQQGNTLILGSTVTLQSLLGKIQSPGEFGLLSDLGEAIRQEVSYNLRNSATIAGTLISADGRSAMTAGFLAMDASLVLLPGEAEIDLGDLLPLRKELLRGRLICKVKIPGQVRLVYESVARTPVDRPLVCAAMATWPSGRIRLAMGGFGKAPSLAYDGTGSDGVEVAARSAYAEAGDEWASAEYRSEMAELLTLRCLDRIERFRQE